MFGLQYCCSELLTHNSPSFHKLLPCLKHCWDVGVYGIKLLLLYIPGQTPIPAFSTILLHEQTTELQTTKPAFDEDLARK